MKSYRYHHHAKKRCFLTGNACATISVIAGVADAGFGTFLAKECRQMQVLQMLDFEHFEQKSAVRPEMH